MYYYIQRNLARSSTYESILHFFKHTCRAVCLFVGKSLDWHQVLLQDIVRMVTLSAHYRILEALDHVEAVGFYFSAKINIARDKAAD